MNLDVLFNTKKVEIDVDGSVIRKRSAIRKKTNYS
jgi:hypothetical protein